MVAAALVAPGVQAAPGVGVSSTLSAVYWDDAQQAGGADDAVGRSVAVAPDGTVLVTGNFRDTAYFPVSADDSIALTSGGNDDVFVAALNAHDSYFAWAQRVGGGADETYASSVAVAADGTVLVTGNFNGTAYFPRSADDSIALTSAGSEDVFVAALNADDSYFAWAQQAGGTDSDVGESVAVAPDGTVLVTGNFRDTAYFPVSADDSIALTSSIGSEDVFVAALNADDSHFAWAQSAGGTGPDFGNSVVVAADSTVLVTGKFAGTALFPVSADDSIALTSTGGPGSYDVFVAALNADDSFFAWAQQAGGTDSDFGNSVAVAPDGTVLITGAIEAGTPPKTAYFPVSADDSIALTSTGYDVFVAALNADDSYFAWAQRVGGDSGDETDASSVTVAADGTVLVAGNFNGAVYLPVSADDSIALTSTGSDDVFVAALSADDSFFAWAQQAGGTASDIGDSVAVATDGTVLVTGYFEGTAYFPVSADDSIALASTGLRDVFVGWLLTPSAPTPPVPPGPAVPPGAPTGVRGEAGDAQVLVTWAPPGSSGSFAITSYQVTAYPGGGGCLVAAPTVACDVTGLTNGTAYTFEVRALNGAGWGLWSQESDPVTPQAPGAVSILITGSRGDVRGKPGVKVTGTSTGVGLGAILRPMLRFPGQLAYTQGTASILVDQDGAFTWQRRTRKKTSVYVITQDGTARSNRVIIPAP